MDARAGAGAGTGAGAGATEAGRVCPASRVGATVVKGDGAGVEEEMRGRAVADAAGVDEGAAMLLLAAKGLDDDELLD